MQRWGMTWQGAEVAAAAEAAGASAFCAGEFAERNTYLTVAEMAAGTRAASIGPGVAYAFARSPFVHASSIRHLSRTAPGRLFLGLGSGTRRMNARWFGVDASAPLPRMGELLEVLRLLLTAEDGTVVRYEGRFYDLEVDIRAPVLGRLDVPLIVGAFNRGMAAVAGRQADGVLGHPLFTDRWWADVIGPIVDAGGRDVLRWGQVMTAIDDDDPDRARLDARRMIAFYFTVKTYDPLAEHHGWQPQVAAIREAFRARDTDAMAAAVPDEMLAAIAIAGTSAEAKDQLAARTDLPSLGFLAAPSFLVGKRRQQAYAHAAIDLMGARS